jgi:hypothetical protein
MNDMPLPIPPSHEELLGISENMEENGCETAGTIASINREFFKLVPSYIESRKAFGSEVPEVYLAQNIERAKPRECMRGRVLSCAHAPNKM